MSQAPHCVHLRDGTKMGNVEFVDTMIKDGLWDAFNGYHMGMTAENVAREWQITREQQDSFAVASQNKAEAAQKAGRFKDEIVPVTIKERKGERIVDTDEYIRARHDAGGICRAATRLREGRDGHGRQCSGINDGAAAVVLMTAEKRRARADAARAYRLLGNGRRRSRRHGHGPDPGHPRGAGESRLEGDDLDLIEANEAFAAQACAVNKELGWDTAKVNVNGGAIAHRSSDRRFGRARARDVAARNAEAQCQEGPRHAVHRRRHGHCHVRRTLNGRR